jgi:hypothetical protein
MGPSQLAVDPSKALANSQKAQKAQKATMQSERMYQYKQSPRTQETTPNYIPGEGRTPYIKAHFLCETLLFSLVVLVAWLFLACRRGYKKQRNQKGGNQEP